MFRFAITDHRARPTRLYGVRDGVPRMESLDAVPREITRRIDERLRQPCETADWIVAGVITIACLVVSMRLVPAMHKSGLGMYVWIPLVVIINIAITVSIAIARRWFFHRRYTGEIVAAFLAERRCPACGYDLAGSKTESDGITVCPECGAAWRMPATAPSAAQ